MNAIDKRFHDAQMAGYRAGEAFDAEHGDLPHGLKAAMLSNGLGLSDMRQYAYGVGFMNACVNTLRAKLAEVRRSGTSHGVPHVGPAPDLAEIDRPFNPLDHEQSR